MLVCVGLRWFALVCVGMPRILEIITTLTFIGFRDQSRNSGEGKTSCSIGSVELFIVDLPLLTKLCQTGYHSAVATKQPSSISHLDLILSKNDLAKTDLVFISTQRSSGKKEFIEIASWASCIFHHSSLRQRTLYYRQDACLQSSRLVLPMSWIQGRKKLSTVSLLCKSVHVGLVSPHVSLLKTTFCRIR